MLCIGPVVGCEGYLLGYAPKNVARVGLPEEIGLGDGRREAGEVDPLAVVSVAQQDPQESCMGDGTDIFGSISPLISRGSYLNR